MENHGILYSKRLKGSRFDAAGGTGKWSIPIAKCGAKVVLGDVSEGMLNMAMEKIRREKLQRRIKLRQCDLRSLDFKDESFDLVFCDHALCFVKEQETVIRELVRVLKKGHLLIISGQNRYVLSLSLVSEDSDYAYGVLSKETQFVMRKSLEVYALSPNELKQMLENNGVKLKRMVGKLFTMPLGLPSERLVSEDYTVDLFEKVLRIELKLTDEPDTVSLGSHFQAVGRKSTPKVSVKHTFT